MKAQHIKIMYELPVAVYRELAAWGQYYYRYAEHEDLQREHERLLREIVAVEAEQSRRADMRKGLLERVENEHL